MRQGRMDWTALAVVLALAASARANELIGMHMGGEARKMTRPECARRAVAAMGKEGFAFAEVGEDGNARGWNAKTSVRVLTFDLPAGDTVLFLVVTASKDNAEAERLRTALRARICDDAADTDAPQRVAPEKDPPPAEPVFLACKQEERSLIPQLRLFEPVATLVVEKRGFGTNPGGRNTIFGGCPGTAVVTFVTPSSKGVSARLNTVVATFDANTSASLARKLLDDLVRMFYE
jgi:hypothetical protein